MARHHYPIHAYKLPHSPPTTAEEVEANKRPPRLEKFEAFAKGNSVDAALRKAREILEDRGLVIRSLSMGKDAVVAYVVDPPADQPKQPRKPLSEKRRTRQYTR